jgi:hypothetical protein
MILLLRLIGKMVKWAVIVVAYMIAGLVKLLAITVVLVVFGSRAAIRHFRAASEDEEEPDPFRGFYDLERRASTPSLDSFDVTVQRERDHRVARRWKEPVE